MNEITKTGIFGIGALLALLLAFFTRPATIEDVSAAIASGTGLLFEKFKDPKSAASLEIIDYDEDEAKIHRFKVAKVKNVWSIPSAEDYPADAQSQMAQAAASLIDLKQLGVADTDRTMHEAFGVIDPDPETLTVGATGVGKRVTIQDRQGKTLARFIIGKADPDRPELHYLRIVGQDAVYRVNIKTDRLSSKFEDWIEKDLLKLNAFDIKQVSINDYSMDLGGGQVAITERFRSTVEYGKDAKWSLRSMQTKDENDEFAEVKLAPDEELDSQKLNDLKNALDDLKIVNVHRKPKSLSEALQGKNDGGLTPEDSQSLVTRGFYLIRVGDGKTGLFSDQGEVVVGMNDGVEYFLRFGQIAGRSRDDDDDKNDDTAKDGKNGGKQAKSKNAKKKGKRVDEAEQEGDAAGDGQNRFIFVMASFNEDLLEKPTLPPMPGEPKPDEAGAETPTTDDKQEGDTPADEGDATKTSEPSEGAKDDADDAADTKQADDDADEKKSDDADKKETEEATEGDDETPGASGDDEVADGERDEVAADDGVADDGAADDVDGDSANEDEPKATPKRKQDSAKKSHGKSSGSDDSEASDSDVEGESGDATEGESEPTKRTKGKSADGKGKSAQKKDADKTDPGADKKLDEERKRVRKERERLQKEYDAKVKQGKERAEKLNARFSEWYYVISDKTYMRIHLGQKEIVKKKGDAKPGADPSVDEFEKLKEKGLPDDDE